jgi:hypothetical protein
VKSSGTAWSRSRAVRSMASWPRRCFLERGDLRLQAAAVSSVRRRSSAGPPSPPSLLVHEQRGSGSSTASPVRRPRLQDGQRPVGPAARRRRALPRAASSPLSPSDSSSSLPPPSLILVRRWMDWGRISHGGADQGRTGWGGFIGRLLGFLGDEWTAGGPWRPRLGHAAGIPRPRLARRGAVETAPRCLSHGASMYGGEERDAGKGWWLTAGAHLAVKQEERWVVDGPAGCVGPKCIGGLRLRRTRGGLRGGLEDLVN